MFRFKYFLAAYFLLFVFISTSLNTLWIEFSPFYIYLNKSIIISLISYFTALIDKNNQTFETLK